MSVQIDSDERAHLVLVLDGIGIRTVVSMAHADGVDLMRQLTEYYGELETFDPANAVKDAPIKKAGLVARMLKRFGHG